jgi:hypothetical protein
VGSYIVVGSGMGTNGVVHKAHTIFILPNQLHFRQVIFVIITKCPTLLPL